MNEREYICFFFFICKNIVLLLVNKCLITSKIRPQLCRKTECQDDLNFRVFNRQNEFISYTGLLRVHTIVRIVTARVFCSMIYRQWYISFADLRRCTTVSSRGQRWLRCTRSSTVSRWPGQTKLNVL